MDRADVVARGRGGAEGNAGAGGGVAAEGNAGAGGGVAAEGNAGAGGGGGAEGNPGDGGGNATGFANPNAEIATGGGNDPVAPPVDVDNKNREEEQGNQGTDGHLRYEDIMVVKL